MGGSSPDKSHNTEASDASSEAPPHVPFERADDFEALRKRCHALEQKIDNLQQLHASLEEALSFEKETRIRLTNELEAARVVQSQFIDNMNHELRTPLNGILGMTQLVLGMPLNSETREYIETIERSGHVLDKIISSLLDYSQLSSSSLEQVAMEFDIESLLEESVQPYAREAFDRRLEFYFIAEDTQQKALGDRFRFRQILDILLDNAVKFTSKGHISVQARITTDPDKSSAPIFIEIKVSDTGIGIAENMHQTIFEPFRQVDGTSTRNFGGIGMGLALCKKLVQLFNGSIEVISAPGMGSTFIATLQLQPALESTIATPVTLTKGVRLGVLTESELMFSAVASFCADAEAVQWLLPSNVSDPLPEDIDILIVDHPVRPEEDRFVPSHAVVNAHRREHPRLIALVDPNTALEGSTRAIYDVISTRPIFRKPLLEAINFAAVMIDRDAHLLADPDTSNSGISVQQACVLVLEPVRINQKILTRMLESLHYDYDISERLEDIPAKLTSRPYHAILINPQIDSSPHFSALKATLAQVNTSSDLPEIIAITGKTASYNVAALRDAGISRLLVVPIKLNQLREALEG